MSLVFFFFSSRRRHTRCLSDWSSDVCSSDLFANAVRFWGEVNPDFFKGTVVEKAAAQVLAQPAGAAAAGSQVSATDRKSTRLNSSHLGISYAVFCLKKKKKQDKKQQIKDTR